MTAPPLHRQATAGPGPGWAWRFGLVFGGQAFSLVGSALSQFVLLWWITDTTGSVSALAFAGLAALLPQAVLSPLGGTLADRWSRRALMIVSDAVSALCMCVLIALFLTGRIELWHAYSMMAVRSAMQAFQLPAASSSVAMLVPAHFLPRAAGLNQMMQSLTLVAAAPLGALAVSLLPMGWALGIDVITVVLGITPLLFLRIPQPRRAPDARTSIAQELREGVQAVWHSPGLLRLYALLGAAMLAVMPTFTLVPLLVKAHFGGGAAEVAWMEGLAGGGMVLGGMLVAALAPRRQMPWVLWGLALSCLAMALTALAPSRLFAVAVLWWTVSGIAFSLGHAPLTALLQTIVPHQLQGRVLSLLHMVEGLASPLGLALASPLGEWLGVRWLFVITGTLGGAVILAGFLSPPLMRLEERSVAGDGDRP